MQPKIVDSHCHLNFPEFANKIPEVIENAEKNGVELMQTICTKMSEFEEVLAIAKSHDAIFASVGVHPNEVANSEIVTTDELLKCSNHPKVIGIGETGLDYYRGQEDREQQIESFKNHIAAARESQLPIIIHTRDADRDTIEILQEESQKGAFPGVIHCFTASYELAKAAIDLGLFVSISGIITFKNAEELRSSVQKLPLEKLLIETDAPFLAPVPNRGKTNEPANVLHTAKYLANFFNVSYDEFARITTNNFYELFTKACKG